MNADMNVLEWGNKQIPHRLWVEKQDDTHTRLCMKIIKDVEPEMLYLDLTASQEQVIGAWQGYAVPISTEYHDAHLYSQVRSLLNLSQGCVVWMVNHIQLPCGNKMSADKLVLIPDMKQFDGNIIAQ
ncbi:hypothetical protein [Photobacterium nomapromontoriensis]|uniref:hypothetical protein n=1 Tax=Photobacterium nomapromontoriensis TaxID=2910237 RepID=UPI003D099FF3